MTETALALIAPGAFALFLFGGRALLLLAVGLAAGAAAGGAFRTRRAAAEGALRGAVLALLLPADVPPLRAAAAAAVAGALPRLLPRIPAAATAHVLLLLLVAAIGGAPRADRAPRPRPITRARPAAEAPAVGLTPLALVRLYGAVPTAERSGEIALAGLAGFRVEAIGTAAALPSLAAGVLLLLRGAAPAAFAAAAVTSLVLTTAVAHAVAPARCAPPLFHLLSGAFLFALFFAAEPFPEGRGGVWAYGLLFGTGTGLWRTWGPTPDGATPALAASAAVIALAGFAAARRGGRPAAADAAAPPSGGPAAP